MKKLMSTLLSTLLLILLSTGCATVAEKTTIVPAPDETYTYEGEVNPDDFMRWDVVGTEHFTAGENNYAQFLLANPDKDSPITQIIAVIYVVNNNMQLVSYGYKKNGVDYVYVLDFEQNRYILWLSRPSKGGI